MGVVGYTCCVISSLSEGTALNDDWLAMLKYYFNR